MKKFPVKPLKFKKGDNVTFMAVNEAFYKGVVIKQSKDLKTVTIKCSDNKIRKNDNPACITRKLI